MMNMMMKNSAEDTFRNIVAELLSMSGALPSEIGDMPMPEPRGTGEFGNPSMIDPAFLQLSGSMEQFQDQNLLSNEGLMNGVELN
jgi:hypothetical protein